MRETFWGKVPWSCLGCWGWISGMLPREVSADVFPWSGLVVTGGDQRGRATSCAPAESRREPQKRLFPRS